MASSPKKTRKAPKKAAKSPKTQGKPRKLTRVKVAVEATEPEEPVTRKKLWAPWRLAYVKSSGPKPAVGCVLCSLQIEKDGPGNLILRRSGSAYLIMNRFPYTNGHLMVVPKRHTADFAALSAAEMRDISTLLQQGVRAVKDAFHAHGCNVGMNLGRVAGAGIDEHLHFHIVPRWNGDTNFMPVLADVNVVNDHLEDAYHALDEVLPKGRARR